ncbi:ORF V: Enzymatic polyprotein [Labeo rohita]|uniref:ORF V: Enzymatic polyprotein n=1 Tax=Labeo rohita TaxID=84645 RepID=A0ABQ8MCR0_LABRO|nr:ORF V: Enzymatic polyprotein [Labeo rohita]
MRPLQWWLRTKGFSPRGNPFRMIKVTLRCLRALDMWKKPWFLSQGPVLGAPCRHVTLATDASLTGLGAVMSGHSARGLWSGRHLTWHINCLEMLAVFRALKHLLPDLIGRHVLVRTDNTAVVYYINHQGGLRLRPLYKLAHQILVWSQDKLLSLRAVHVPGHLNMGADILSRQGPRPGEWMLHPEVVKQIWRVFGQAQVDLFATQENVQYPHWFSLTHPAPLGLDAMVQTWPRLRLYAFPPIALLPGVLERVRRDGVRFLLVAPYWPARAWFSDLISLLNGSPWEIPVRRDLLSQAGGTILHPRPELWKLWASPLHLEGLRGGYCGLPRPTWWPFSGQRPPYSTLGPTWDLAVMLEALCRPPFEATEESSDHHLSVKTVLLLALTSLKRVGDLQALSVPSSAPRPVVLQAFCPPPFREPDQQKLNCMCPVRVLDTYVHRATLWRKSDQLFVCYGPPNRGLPASKHSLSRWIVDAISLAYEFSGLPSPLGVKAHSTRGISASKAFMSGVSMQDICDAVGWSTPLTFVRFYDLDLRVAPGFCPSS